jgi:hypothetical protein
MASAVHSKSKYLGLFYYTLFNVQDACIPMSRARKATATQSKYLRFFCYCLFNVYDDIPVRRAMILVSDNYRFTQSKFKILVVLSL